MNKSFKTKAKSDLALDDKGYIQRSKLPDYFTEKKEASEVKAHDKVIEEKKNKYQTRLSKDRLFKYCKL